MKKESKWTPEYKKNYMKEWYKNHQGKRNEYQRNWAHKRAIMLSGTTYRPDYYSKNRDKYAKSMKKYFETHREEWNSYYKKWYKKNQETYYKSEEHLEKRRKVRSTEEHKKIQADYYQKNKERLKEMAILYYKKNKDKIQQKQKEKRQKIKQILNEYKRSDK